MSDAVAHEFRVLLFGPQAQLAGARAVTISLSGEVENVTAGRLLAALAAEHPALAPSAASSRLAVDRVFVDADTPVEPGAEVALIGMVSGG